MKDVLKDDLIKLLDKHGRLPKFYHRNLKIKQKHDKMITSRIPPKIVREKLSEEFCMSTKNIETVLYNKKHKNGSIIIIV